MNRLKVDKERLTDEEIDKVSKEQYVNWYTDYDEGNKQSSFGLGAKWARSRMEKKGES